MSDVRELRDLYQEVILEHSKKPKNFRALETANHKAEGFNPLCGDHFTDLCRRERWRDQRHWFSGQRLRYLQGLGLHDDADAQRQDRERSGRHFYKIS